MTGIFLENTQNMSNLVNIIWRIF